jgi:hypothetical protein
VLYRVTNRNLIYFEWVVLRKWEGVVGTGWSGLRIGTGGVHL